jgi:Zn-dependent protease
MNVQAALVFLPGLLIGLTIHEASHAISAKWLGDPTAESLGRVSLNPLRHLDPIGTIALFALGFGWGKPVPINLNNFKKPRFYYLLSSLAGPASNLLVAAVCLGILWLPIPGQLRMILEGVFYINCILAVINLLPIPPLDGSKIWPCLIPGLPLTIPPLAMTVWMVILVAAFMTGATSKIIYPILNILTGLLP